MRGFGFGIGKRRWSDGAAVAVPDPTPVGLALNGSTNAALKTMVARVRAGTGRGRIVWKGDSTTVGQGSGAGAPYYLAGARANRVPAAFAAAFSAAGTPTLDNAMVGDNGINQAGGFPFTSFDPRFAIGSPTGSFAIYQALPGGSYYTPNTGVCSFTPTTNVNTFEVVTYNLGASVLTYLIDGAAPQSIVIDKSTGSPSATTVGNTVVIANGTGFSRAVITASTTGPHTLSCTSNTVSGAGIRSIMGFASGTRAIDILVHASLGATASDQAHISSEGWTNNGALAFDMPDLTIINCGLNDMAGGVSPSAYAASLQTIITTAKATGDVLLMFPHRCIAPLSNNVVNYMATAAALAASNGCAFMSLDQYFGGVVDARLVDGGHGNAAFYAEVGDVVKRCITAMVA
jgi:hypothetical protein